MGAILEPSPKVSLNQKKGKLATKPQKYYK